ncbi:hypothetical protein A2U01_0018344 [Trifolium medium]|uniref:Uncharacterized protein n=1 Tax=Trifolium medium TaxID=97028 RepID=A0A392NC11_9FABA|nr:hypothetical protein [Trifolium medium]
MRRGNPLRQMSSNLKSLLLCLGATTWGAPVLDWATNWPKSPRARHNELEHMLGITSQLSCLAQ